MTNLEVKQKYETLYSCIACGFMYGEIVSSCDCHGNKHNEYEVFLATSTGRIVTKEDINDNE